MTTSRAGRPRDTSIDDRVLAAAAEVLDQHGLDALSLEDVARRAAVSKAAVYRRWSSRSRLSLAALAPRLRRITAPDSGCTLCDLHEVLDTTGDVYASLGAGTVAQLLASTDADLHIDLVAALVDPVRQVVTTALRTARDRGDLRPETDLAIVCDTLCALVFHRLLLGLDPLTADEVERVIVGLLRGVAVDGDALVQQYSDHRPH